MVRFGLVAFPVEALNAHASAETPVVLHQLHAECHSRIRYQKTCPIHGPVSNEEIVSGYEYGKGQYVEIEAEELDELRTDGERALNIDAFILPEEVDPILLDGRMYFLVPDGDSAREPYAEFLEALERQARWGIGQVVFSGKQQLVIVRPYRRVLHMAMLNYAARIRDPRETVKSAPGVAATDKKIRLAEQLIESWTEKDYDLAKYTDTYSAKVKDLIRAKAAGHNVVVPEAVEEEPEVINLMDALRKSIGKRPGHGPVNRNGKSPGSSHRKPHGRRRHAS